MLNLNFIITIYEQSLRTPYHQYQKSPFCQQRSEKKSVQLPTIHRLLFLQQGIGIQNSPPPKPNRAAQGSFKLSSGLKRHTKRQNCLTVVLTHASTGLIRKNIAQVHARRKKVSGRMEVQLPSRDVDIEQPHSGHYQGKHAPQTKIVMIIFSQFINHDFMILLFFTRFHSILLNRPLLTIIFCAK